MAYKRHNLGGISTSAAGAAIGTVIPGVGTVLGGAAGSLVGGLFGSNLAPISPMNVPVTTPSGTLTYAYGGRQISPQQTAGYIFGQWAASGASGLAALEQIASTGSGPKWDNPSQTFSGYGSYDRQFAQAIVDAYSNATHPITGAPLYNPSTTTSLVPQPAGTPAGSSPAGLGVFVGVGLVGAVLYAMLRPAPKRRYARNPGRRHRARARRRTTRRR